MGERETDMVKAALEKAKGAVSGRGVRRGNLSSGSEQYDKGTGNNNNKGYTVNNLSGYMEVCSNKDWYNMSV
jgi:hypothetical protein